MNTFFLISTSLASAVMVWRLWLRLRYFMHMFQLEGYKLNEFAQWLGSNKEIQFTLSHKVGLFLSVCLLGLSFLTGMNWLSAVVMLIWIPSFLFTPNYGSEGQKKPLVYTARMKRLWVVSLLLLFLILIGFIILSITFRFRLYYVPVLLLFIDIAMPKLVQLTGSILQPFEKNIHDGFKTQARAKLASLPELQSIGITGSFGKTSVKFILEEILSQKLSVLATPSSFNTPMGISRVVNNDLQSRHQVFIAEMGARYEGDIEELVDLVHPQIGVVTSVGPAHLETMGPIEKIARVKGELIRGLPESGLAVLNMDDPHVKEMAKECKANVIFVSTKDSNADFLASDISYDNTGSRFRVSNTKFGSSSAFQSKLLGEHNVLNILLGIGIASYFGIQLRQMAHAVTRIEPIPHRLALRKQGGLYVIDDAFNSNPVGSKNAIDILSSFPRGKKIVITPGMVELGDQQEKYNRDFGAYMAGKVDVVILVGQKQTGPIQQGLKESGFPNEQVHIVKSLFDAQDLLPRLSKDGDVVLYENDLPDQYNEE